MIKKHFLVNVLAALQLSSAFAQPPTEKFVQDEAWQLLTSRYIGFLQSRSSSDLDIGLLIPEKTPVNKADAKFVARAFTTNTQIEYTLYSGGLKISEGKNTVIIQPINLATGEYLINGKKFVYDPKREIKAQFRETFPEAFKTVDASSLLKHFLIPEAFAEDLEDYEMGGLMIAGMKTGRIVIHGLVAADAAIGVVTMPPVWVFAAALVVGAAVGGIVYCAIDMHFKESSGQDFGNCLARPMKWVGLPSPRDRLYSAKVSCEEKNGIMTASVRLQSSTRREQYRRFAFDSNGNLQKVDFAEGTQDGVVEFKDLRATKVKFRSQAVTDQSALRDYHGLSGDGYYYAHLCRDKKRLDRFNKTAWDSGSHRGVEVPLAPGTTK